MHTEHLQRVRPGLVMLAWFIAVAVASLVTIVAAAAGFEVDSGAGTRFAIAAVAIGFFAGGLFAGLRAAEAPILHGIAIGMLSLVVWFFLNVAATLAFTGFGWAALTPELAVSIVLLQIVAAVIGARFGYRMRVGSALRGEPTEQG